MKILIIIMLGFYSFSTFSQVIAVENKKTKNGHFLSIAIKTKDSIKHYAANCGFKDVTKLSEPEKIQLIGSLISYLKDTSITSVFVYSLSNHYMGKKYPVSRRYNTQIDALILINYISFSSYAFSYSPFPVLFDSQTKTEVTSSCEGLDSVIAKYKIWYNKIRQEGFVNYYLPLWGGRYQWFGSIMANIKFNKYPIWEDYYSCKAIE